MPRVTPAQLKQLQSKTENVRNICILAHVDHGKTSLSDTLLATNGIISERLSGAVRYLDYCEDEQRRKITMKSAAISLLHKNQYLVNLVDSPGHVDFSGEVSAAVRVTDGALLLVDSMEGVCIQTRVVMQQAWNERLTLCLVFTKVDRLINEAKMTPAEAYTHLYKILEQVNALAGTLIHEDSLRRESGHNSILSHSSSDSSIDSDNDNGGNVEDQPYFSPVKGNVVFSSSIHHWAFRTIDFARMYAMKLGLNETALQKIMWGEYYLDMKRKKVLTKPSNAAISQVFVQLALRPLWEVYGAVYDEDAEKLRKILVGLKIDRLVAQRDLASSEKANVITSVMSKWLPIGDCVLDAVVEQLPSPLDAQKNRIDALLASLPASAPESLVESADAYQKAISECNTSEDSPVIAYVVKMFSLDSKEYAMAFRRYSTPKASSVDIRQTLVHVGHSSSSNNNNNTSISNNTSTNTTQTTTISTQSIQTTQDTITQTNNNNSSEKVLIDLDSGTTTTAKPEEPQSANRSKWDEYEDEESNEDTVTPGMESFIAVARVFCGVLKPGQKIYVLSPKYDPLVPGQYVKETTVGSLFLLMGQSLEQVECVPAGNICGISGLGGVIGKTATLSTSPACKPIKSLWSLNNKPIVRVAVETVNSADTWKLVRGLRMLNQADPMCQTMIQETGEQVVIGAGELHLERCLHDLREVYAKTPINVSEPIVPFRETVVTPLSAPTKCEKSTANKRAVISVRAFQLPEAVVDLIESRQSEIAAICTQTQVSDTAAAFTEALRTAFKTCSDQGAQWDELIDKIWAFGPHRTGANILFNNIPAYTDWTPFLTRTQTFTSTNEMWSLEAKLRNAGDKDASGEFGLLKPSMYDSSKVTLFGLDSSIVSGFQAAVSSGPLCSEPMRGVGFIVDNIDFIETENNNNNNNNNDSGINDDIDNNDDDDDEYEDDFFDDYEPEEDTLGPMSGQIIAAMNEACKGAFEAGQMRLVEPLYLCEVQVSSTMLGRTCDVLHRRRSKILSEDIREGTATFIVHAHLPVIESFGLAEEILKKTSGEAIPQLVFDKYETLDIDPFFVPTTEEELAEFGEGSGGGIPPNIAKKYIDMTRRRKGLIVLEKLVEHADKQRTRSKKK